MPPSLSLGLITHFPYFTSEDPVKIMFYLHLSSILTDGGSTPARELRQVVAGIIQSDPVTYTDSVLEQSRDKYVQWIQRDDSWGGTYVRTYVKD